MNRSLPAFSVHGISQTRILEWVRFLLQGIFPTQGSNLLLLCLLRWQEDFLPLSHQRSPYRYVCMYVYMCVCVYMCACIYVCMYICVHVYMCVCMGLSVAQWVKNLPAMQESAHDAGDLGLIPGSGRFPWRRKWQPTTVLLPGKSHGQRRLVGYSPWGRKSQT